jgi:hypothetical protein
MNAFTDSLSTVETAEVAAHTILLRHGTYCIYVVDVSSGVPDDHLPGLGISPAPGEENNVIEVVRFSGEQWLRQRGDALLLRVHASRVRILLTSYNLARAQGATPPKIEIQRLDPAQTPQAPAAPVADETAVDMIVHLRNRGDVRGRFGEWVGDDMGELWVEGFTVTPPASLLAGKLEYQAVLGKGWTSPWVGVGAFCGTRGLQIPIQGLRLRLDDQDARAPTILASAKFTGGTIKEGVPLNTFCSVEPLLPVTALRLDLVPAGGSARPAVTIKDKAASLVRKARK